MADRAASLPRLLLRRGPLPLLLALRYLKSTRRDAFASFLSAVAAGGIGLGVAALILSLAVISGFQEALRGEVLARTPQILVDLPQLPSGVDPEVVRGQVARVPGVVSARFEVRGHGWVVDGGKVQAVELIGFDGAVPAFFPGAAGKAPGLYLPQGLVTRWGLRPGETVDIASPKPTLAPFGGPQPRVRSLPLAGTFTTGKAQETQERIGLPRAVAETLLGRDSLRIDVATPDLDAALAVAARLGAVLPAGARVRTWQDLNRPLLFALRLEKAMTFVAVFLIVAVAALALVADLSLVIASKRAEIGMLGAMGLPARDLARTFLWLGGLIAGIGIAGGAILGCTAAWVMDHYQLISVPGRVYFLDHVPFLLQVRDLAWVLALTFGLALAASRMAARQAALLVPIEAIRR